MKISYRGILGDGIFTLACSAAANACLVLSGILVMRRLGPLPGRTDEFFLLVGLMSLGTMAANLGVPLAAAKLLSRQRAAADGAALGALIALACKLTLAAAALALLGLGLYAAFGRAALAGNPMPLMACVFFWALEKSVSGVMQGLGRLRLAAAYEAALEMLRVALLALVLARGGAAPEVMRAWAWAGAGHLLAGFALTAGIMRKENIPLTLFEPSRFIFKEYAPLALSLFFPFAGFYALSQLLVIALARAAHPGDASHWAIAGQFASALLLLAGPLGTVLIPHYSQGAEGASSLQVMKAARPILMLAAVVLGAAALALCLLASPLLALLYTPENVPPLWLARGLCALYAVEAFKLAMDPLLITLGRWKALAVLEAARTAAAAAAGYWLMQRWPLAGALAGMAVAVLLNAAGKAGLHRVSRA